MSDRVIKIEGLDTPIHWGEFPSFYSDGVIGSAHVAGHQRIVLGQVTFNPDPDATAPSMKPVCEIILAPDALQHLLSYLQDLRGQAEAEDVEPA